MGEDIRLYAWNPTTEKWEGFEGVVSNFLAKNISNVGNITGKAGGITITGGTGASDDIRIVSTSHATKGHIQFHNASYHIRPDGTLSIGDRLVLSGAPEYIVFGTGADEYAYLSSSGGISIRSSEGVTDALFVLGHDGTIMMRPYLGKMIYIGSSSIYCLIDHDGNITFSGTQTVDGIDVSAHDPAATGVHGVGTDFIAKSKISQQYAVTRVIYPHFPFASYADLGGTTCFPTRVGLATSAFETTAQTKFPKCTIKEIRFNVTLNEQTAASTITLRLNGVDTAITVSIPATTTGWFSAIGSVAVAENDLISVKAVFGGIAANDFGFKGGEIVYEA